MTRQRRGNPHLALWIWVWIALVPPAPLAAQNEFVTFIISSNQNMTGAVEAPFITFQTWDGSIWTAWIKGGKIVTGPSGNLFSSRSQDTLNYVDPEGQHCEAKFEAGKFIHTLKGETAPFSTQESINYRCWDGRPLYARIQAPMNIPVAVVASGPVHVGPRFTFAEGEITDWQTNLVWKEGPNKDTGFNEAQEWIKTLGPGWRNPTQQELKGLFFRRDGGGLKGNMPAAFPKLDGTVVWAEENDPATGWYVGFIYGNVYTLGRDKSRFARAFAVRTR